MPRLIVRGNPITLDAYYRDGSNTLTTPVDPSLDIKNELGVTVLTVVPDFPSPGHGRYVYDVPGGAGLGAWEASWSGTINGEPVLDDDGFTVVAAGSLSGGNADGQTCQPWATSADVCSPCDDYALDTVLLDDKIQMATDVLFNLTGKRWPGECTDVIRPQAQYRAGDHRSWSAGGRFGFCSCHRGREVGCSWMGEIKLPGHPVSAVSVLLNGDEFTDWRLDDRRYLVRTDGDGWPCCQDMDADPAADDDTFEITYVYGKRPPIGGVVAAATLGCQYALACEPEAVRDGRCRLPKNIASIARAGTTTNFFDPQKLIADGQVGIAEVDQWVMSILTGDTRRRATVMVPGQTRSARRPGIRG